MFVLPLRWVLDACRGPYFGRASALTLIPVLVLGLTTPSSLAQVSESPERALTYRIEGLSDRLRANVRAHLGASPADRGAAERFLVTAPARAREALEALGHYDARIDVEVDRGRRPWLARFQIEPGQALRYTDVDVELIGPGASDPALARLLEERAPGVGDTLHHGVYENFRDDLQQLARQRGFFDASLEEHRIAVDVRARSVHLTLRFRTGPRYVFGPLRADDALLDDAFLARLKSVREGEPYTQDGLLQLRQRLLRLGFFSSVVVLPELTDRSDGAVPIRVDVVRAPRHSYELGVGFSTDTRERVSLLWNTPRVNRRGHSQQTSLRWSPINPEFRVTYTIPMNDLASDVTQVITRLENNEYGDLDSLQRELALRRERVFRNGVVSGRVRGLNETWRVSGDDLHADFVLAGVSFSTRQRDGLAVDPKAGLSQFYEVEIGGEGVGSDEDLLRAHAQWVGVRRFGSAWRLVARGELGYLLSGSSRADEIPPSLTFFAGGDNSVRGYAYQSIGRDFIPSTPRSPTPTSPPALTVGGTRLVTASLEIQRYLNPTWRVAAFADTGDAFTGENFDPEVGLGVGVHYLSPVGALRLEVASPVTEDASAWRIHINIGAEF